MVDEIKTVEYTIVEVNEQHGIKIDSGEFENVIVRIDQLQVIDDGSDDPETGQAVLNFEYTIIYDAEKSEELFETVEFKDTIGDILLKMIIDSTENSVEFEQTYFEEPEL